MRGAKLLLGGLALLALSAVNAAPSGVGKTVYEGTCIACHGADGAGSLPGVPDFGSKNGPLRNSDAVLIKRIMQGFQGPDSPMAMPPKGGNPSLTDEQVKEVLRYIQQEFGKP